MSSKKGKLNDEQRAFIVRQIACFSTPQEAANALYQEFGVKVTPQNIEKYDYRKQAGKKCAKKWRVLFDAARQQFITNFADSATNSHKAVRIRELSKAADHYKKAGNFMAMSAMYEKIAKEIGNVYANRTELTGKGGGAIKVEAVEDMTKEQVEAELRGYGIDPNVHRAPIVQQ